MLDRAAQDFHTLTADIEHMKYTAVVKDTSTETGQIFVRRDDKMRIEFQKPDPRTILRNRRFALHLHAQDQSRRGIQHWQAPRLCRPVPSAGIRNEGRYAEEKLCCHIDRRRIEFDSRKTVVLELTPKSEQARSQIARIRMWIDEGILAPGSAEIF